MEIQNVKFSVSKKLSLLVLAITLPFVLVVFYVGQQLKEVGEEIYKIQESDLPAIQQLSELEIAEFRRHFVAERANILQSSADKRPGELARLASQYAAYTAEVDQVLGVGSGENESLRSALTHIQSDSGSSEMTALYQKMRAQQSTIAKSAQVLFDPASSSQAAADSWEVLLESFHEIETNGKRILDAIIAQSQQDAETLAQDESELIRSVALASIVIVLFSIVFAWKLIVSITRPLNRITELSTRIAGGDLTSAEINLDSSDELAVLAHSFRQMQQSMREQIVQIKGSIETLGASIQQTSSSIQEQASSTKEEAATIQEITTTMQEIQQSGSEIGQRAKEISEKSDENIAASEDGLKAVEATTRSMGLIREQIEEVAEKIVNLSDKTQAIGDIVTTVNDIAEQSNILAINASIEAASAGESGSRFSVVAQEMKNLADQAKESTRQVRVILGDIQKGINTSVMLTEEAVKRSEVGKTHSEVADRSIRDLLEATQESMEAFQQIMAGTNQQQIGVDQVAQGMRDIRQAVQQTVAGISELEQATKNLNEMSKQLRGFINRYTL